MVEVTQDRLKSLYEYNPVTGVFTSRRYNKPVGFNHRGYLVVDLWHQGKQRKFKMHQLAWLYMYGNWPKPMIDHINGIRTDNRIDNLREVTMSQNAQNRRIPYKTKSGLPRSGFKGVHWVRASNKWRASIGFDGKVMALGLFDDPEKAFLAYKHAAEKLHTHNEQIK
jgi:HNH endonuclease/AP2 domain